MKWENIFKAEAYTEISNKILTAPRYVQTAWGEVMRWLGEQQ